MDKITREDILERISYTNQNTIVEDKKKISNEIQEQIRMFLSKGGQIKQYNTGTCLGIFDRFVIRPLSDVDERIRAIKLESSKYQR